MNIYLYNYSRNVHYSREKGTKTNNISIMSEFKTEIFSENISLRAVYTEIYRKQISVSV